MRARSKAFDKRFQTMPLVRGTANSPLRYCIFLRSLTRESKTPCFVPFRQQENQNGSDIPQSPASTSQTATSPVQTALSPVSQVPSFLESSLGTVPSVHSTALPPSRYPIAADGFHSQFPPLSMSVPNSFGNSRLPEMQNGMARSPGRDVEQSYGSPSDHPVTPVIGHITSVFADSSLQVREEIYTAFNTIYTVLCEFRKP